MAGIDPRYARLSTTSWRRQESGGDYWTPIREAQMYEIRAAIQDLGYPRKPRYGQSGNGAEAARYALAIDLHGMRSHEHWKQGVGAMRPEFEFILRELSE